MRMRYAVAVGIALALGVAALGASRVGAAKVLTPLVTARPPDPPSPLQRAEIQNDMKQLQLYQAQVQILNYQFDQTKAALQVKLKALERDGWDLDLNSWTYTPKAPSPKR